MADQLNVNGTATLGGTFKPTIAAGYNPDWGDLATVLTANGAMVGTFSVAIVLVLLIPLTSSHMKNIRDQLEARRGHLGGEVDQ